MKRLFSGFAVLALAAMPLAAQAATFASGQEYSRAPANRVSGDLYVAGGTVSIASDVSGDLLATGGSISVSGAVSDDVTMAAGTVQLLGPVGDDVRVGGGQVSISSQVGGDLLVMGGMVHLMSSATVHGDVYVMAGQVIIDGNVNGDVHATGGRLTVNGTVSGMVQAKVSDALVVGPDARIRGALSYSSPREASIADGAVIGGVVQYEPIARMHVDKGTAAAVFWAAVATVTAMKMLALAGMAILLVWRWRRWSLEIIQQTAENFWPHVGKGLLYAILVPIACVLLMLSFIGSLPGLVVMLTYVSVMIVAKVLSGMFLGAWLSAKMAKRTALHVTWANAIGGTVLIELITLVPVLGMLAKVILCLAVFGVLVEHVRRQLWNR